MCKKDPIEFWKYTPDETSLMINRSGENIKIEKEFEAQKHAEILTAIMNTSFGPYLKKGAKYPYEAEQFLPKQKKEKMTAEQYELALRQQTIAMGGTVTYK